MITVTPTHPEAIAEGCFFRLMAVHVDRLYRERFIGKPRCFFGWGGKPSADPEISESALLRDASKRMACSCGGGGRGITLLMGGFRHLNPLPLFFADDDHDAQAKDEQAITDE